MSTKVDSRENLIIYSVTVGNVPEKLLTLGILNHVNNRKASDIRAGVSQSVWGCGGGQPEDRRGSEASFFVPSAT